jgi:hypothetical protein
VLRDKEPQPFVVPLPLVSVALDADGDLFAVSKQGILYVLGPDGTPRRMQHLIDDGSRAISGQLPVKATSLLGIDAGVLVEEKDGFAVVRGGLERGFARDASTFAFAPPAGSSTFLDSGREVWARNGVRLRHLAGSSWAEVRFIEIPPPKKEPEVDTDEDGVAPIATAQATVAR